MRKATTAAAKLLRASAVASAPVPQALRGAEQQTSQATSQRDAHRRLATGFETAEFPGDQSMSERSPWSEQSPDWDATSAYDDEQPQSFRSATDYSSGLGTGPGMSSFSQAVEPPRQCAWHQEHANTVKLIGLVGAPPVVRELRGGNAVATVRLGVNSKMNFGQRRMSWINTEFWGHEALQVQQYVLKGMQLAVNGRLQKDIWTAHSGETRSAVKVVADDFSVVIPGIASLSDPAELPPAATNGSIDPQQAAAGAQSENQAKKRRRRGPSSADLAVHSAWMADASATWGALAAGQGVKPERVVGGLVHCATGGVSTDIRRLAAELQIGPAGSAWICVHDVAAAIEQARSLAAEIGMPSELDSMRIKPVREVLATEPGTTHKVLSQEQACGSYLTYAQIRLVLGSMLLGTRLEDFATEIPPPISTVVGGLSMFPSIESAEEAPF